MAEPDDPTTKPSNKPPLGEPDAPKSGPVALVYIDMSTDFLLGLFTEGGIASTGRIETPGRRIEVMEGLPPGSKIVGCEFDFVGSKIRISIECPIRERLRDGDLVLITNRSTELEATEERHDTPDPDPR